MRCDARQFIFERSEEAHAIPHMVMDVAARIVTRAASDFMIYGKTDDSCYAMLL